MRLSLENVGKSYPGRKVFENISIKIAQNEKLVITGPNGSGKTTLINVISSMLPKSSGKISFELDGKQYSGSELLPFSGIVSPDFYFYDELTANENLSFFAHVSGLERNNFQNELARVGLEGRGDDPVKSYSSGMKHRLKYVLVLINNPPLLFLDEPTANLDDNGKAIVKDIIHSRKDCITIIATNETDELNYADKTIKLA